MPTASFPERFYANDLDVTAQLSAISERLQHEAAALAAAEPGTADAAASVAGAGGPGGPGAGGPAGAADSSGAPSAAGTVGTAGTATVSWLRDLPTATDGLKHKLQHARTQIRELPDIGRTVPEQEAEIRALEERLQKQRAVLHQLRDTGTRFAEGEQQGDRMEL